MLEKFFHWLSMVGYSSYVWPAYGFAGAILIMNIVGIKIQGRKTRKKLLNWFKRQSQ